MSNHPTILRPGTSAPDFTLHATPDQTVSLSEFRGRTIILAFYPADWSLVCGDQMSLYNEILPEFRKHGAELIGISVDGAWCHSAFVTARHLHFPLLADFEPKGEVSRAYGAYRAQDGTSERALFVIDGEGVIRWSYCGPVGVNPGADGILDALDDMQRSKGGARPVSRHSNLRPEVDAEDHTIGPAEAPVTLVEYGDYQCPHCYRAHPIVAALRKRLGNRLRFVFRNFPLTEGHPNALHAAEAAESVATHAGATAFWAMHDTIYQHQQDSDDALDDAHLIRYAADAGADASVVQRDLIDETFAERVHADFTSGVRSGVNGTPTFFINGFRFDGDWTNPDKFLSALEAAAR